MLSLVSISFSPLIHFSFYFPLIYFNHINNRPSGSTAYSMAAGGSVVHPAVPCILVTPICPHVLSFRSMVFPDHVVLRCFVPDDARSTASVAFDGKHRCELQRGDSVQIQMSAYPVPTINKGDHSSDWLESLKRSFNFNTRPRQKPLS
ncbi:MAG: NAD+ kinase [Bacillariaceae sp.]|jgi:NAD+ kinase